jgi:hypothetical protein
MALDPDARAEVQTMIQAAIYADRDLRRETTDVAISEALRRSTSLSFMPCVIAEFDAEDASIAYCQPDDNTELPIPATMLTPGLAVDDRAMMLLAKPNGVFVLGPIPI